MPAAAEGEIERSRRLVSSSAIERSSGELLFCFGGVGPQEEQHHLLEHEEPFLLRESITGGRRGGRLRVVIVGDDGVGDVVSVPYTCAAARASIAADAPAEPLVGS